jgi:uncharacterized protein (TIGR01777 family)
VKVVVTGATGFIGRALTAALTARGDEVTALTRDPARAAPTLPPGVRCVASDLESPGPWRAALAGADAVVHLAGESIGGKRWDARQKQALRDSRVEATRHLVEALAELAVVERPTTLVSASGVDYYAFASTVSEFDDDEVTEADPPSDSFLGRLCRDWEREARAAEGARLRVVTMRTGLVLGAGGGALAKMALPFKYFLGGRIGSGRQWMSWIHLDDAVAGYLAALDDPRLDGPVNLVAPEAVRNAAFTRALGHALGRPGLFPVPAFALRAAVGELAEYLLEGRRVVPRALEAVGFTWKRPTVAAALADGG